MHLNTKLKARIARVYSTANLLRLPTDVERPWQSDRLAIQAVDEDGRQVYVSLGDDQIGRLAAMLRYYTPLTVDMPVFVAGWPGKYRVVQVNTAGLNIGAHGRVFVKPDGHDGPSAWVRRALVIPACA